MDWLTHIDDFTNQLADIAEVGDLSAPVPTCPDWTLADLAWHLLEVQDFWTWIIGNRPAGPDNYVGPERPSDNELATGLREACDRLVTALAAADPSEEAWSWTHDHTVGFTYRRQAHEAFVHLADAIATTGGSIPVVPPAFGADGIDELVTNNLEPIPPWGTFTPGRESLIALRSTDIERDWTFRFGTFNGTSPNSGTTYTDEPQVQPADGAAATIIRGEAATLDLWMWGRVDDAAVTVEGDEAHAVALRAVISGETQ